MDKSIVAETVGSPTITRRIRGQDHWIYKFRNGKPEDHTVREVHFERGYAVYVGTPISPQITAADQDRLNADAEAAERAREEILANSRDSHLGAQSGQSRTHEDPLSRKLRQSFYGIEPSEKDERRKQAPTFEPIQ